MYTPLQVCMFLQTTTLFEGAGSSAPPAVIPRMWEAGWRGKIGMQAILRKWDGIWVN